MMNKPTNGISNGSYRFGFQGQEKDDEIHGAAGTSYAYEYRMHDPRVGRFLSIDPLAAKYAYNSPYAFSENRVIDGVELEGLEVVLNQDRRVDGVTIGMNASKRNDPSGAAGPINTTEVFDHTTDAAGLITDPNANPSSTSDDVSQRMRQYRAQVNGNGPTSANWLASATTVNPAGTDFAPQNNSVLPNQFDQGILVSPPAAPAGAIPNILGQATSYIQTPNSAMALGGPAAPRVTTMANNTMRLTIVTNGTVAANAAAQAAAVALPGAVGEPNLQVQVLADAAFIAAQPRGVPQSMVVFLNPTTNGMNAWGIAPASLAVPIWQSANWTPMIPQAPVRNAQRFNDPEDR